MVHSYMQQFTDSLFDISGKVGVVTGAGGELCGTMAVHLASRGAIIVLLDINLDAAEARVEKIRGNGGEASAYSCNVLDRTRLEEINEELADRYGKIDFLINGAGGNHPSATTDGPFATVDRSDSEGARESARAGDVQGGTHTFLDLPEEGYRKVFDLNYMGTVLPSQVFARSMLHAGAGCIVNISSLNALTPLTKIPAYATAKAAVANLTRWLAVHFAHSGIRVNALAPGFFMTEQLRFLHTDRQTGEPTARSKQIIQQTPFGRYGEPAELVGTVVWLLSEASSFVTGTLIPVDGGFSSYSL